MDSRTAREIRRRHRSEPAALNGSARRQRKRSKRAAVKRPEKRDDVEPLCVIPRQLDGGLDGLGARIRKKRLRAAADRRDRRERLAQRDLRLVIVVCGNVEEPRRLLRDRADDVGMRMSCRRHRDACAEIQVRVPSTSSTTAPSPLAMTKGTLRGYDGDTTARSRSIIARARGPGGGTLM